MSMAKRFMTKRYSNRRTNREERRRMKELRKLKKMELLEDSKYSPSFIESNAMINLALFIFSSCAILGFANIELSIILILCTLALILSLLFIESLLKSIISHMADFFSDDRQRRRAYKETQKVINYALANDKISDEHITLMLENLIYNARAEQQSSNNKDYRTIYIPGTEPEEVKEVKEVKQIEESTKEIKPRGVIELPVTNTTAPTKLSLVFNDSHIDVMNGNEAIEKVSYDEIIQPTTEEEISSMPYSTIYGYVKRADKTIYIDMENESAIIK